MGDENSITEEKDGGEKICRSGRGDDLEKRVASNWTEGTTPLALTRLCISNDLLSVFLFLSLTGGIHYPTARTRK